MKFSFRARRMTAEEVKMEAARQREVDIFLQACPRLDRGKVRFDGVAELMDDAWTPDELRDLADAWPELSYAGLTLLVTYARVARQKVPGRDFNELLDWLKVLYVVKPPDRLSDSALSRAKADEWGLTDPLDVMEKYFVEFANALTTAEKDARNV